MVQKLREEFKKEECNGMSMITSVIVVELHHWLRRGVVEPRSSGFLPLTRSASRMSLNEVTVWKFSLVPPSFQN
jgi:hypothetical protein